jgi:hypothetical protein
VPPPGLEDANGIAKCGTCNHALSTASHARVVKYVAIVMLLY